jgi:hypothetical protein
MVVHTRAHWKFFDQAAPGDDSASVHVVDFHLPNPRNTFMDFPHEGSSMPTLQGFKYFSMKDDLPLTEI